MPVNNEQPSLQLVPVNNPYRRDNMDRVNANTDVLIGQVEQLLKKKRRREIFARYA